MQIRAVPSQGNRVMLRVFPTLNDSCTVICFRFRKVNHITGHRPTVVNMRLKWTSAAVIHCLKAVWMWNYINMAHVLWNRVHDDLSRSSKIVLDFGTNRKRIWDFLLVLNSNLGPILAYFRDIGAFVRWKPLSPYQPLLWPNFRGVPFGVDRWCWGL